jgi:pimeloyl-ACP methyl ester carboxylesterase
MTAIAILIPGIMGSVLEYNGEQIWPGSLTELWFPYGKMAQLTQDNLVATDVIRSVSISDQYGTIIEDLGACGFREADNPQTLFVCPYDWRKDNALAAHKLADLIDSVVALNPGGTEISLIAHSMGGLISRYYLESGDFVGRQGFKSVHQLITLGTPHRGAPLALSAAMGEEKRLWLNADQVLQIASDPRYPALYQLLPPRGEPFAWDRSAGSRYEPVDIYDAAIAEGMGLVESNLAAAIAFQSKIDPDRRPAYTRYFTFVGTRQTMVSHVLVRKVGSAYRVEKVETEDAGDGTVPAWSGALTGLQGQPVGGEHGTIYKNDDLRRTLAGLLGKIGVLAAAEQQVEVAIRERVCHPEDLVHVALTFPNGATDLQGELKVEKAQFDSANKHIGFTQPAAHVIQYVGLTAEKLNVLMKAPTVPGIYRVAFYISGESDPTGWDDLFVQRRQ